MIKLMLTTIIILQLRISEQPLSEVKKYLYNIIKKSPTIYDFLNRK